MDAVKSPLQSLTIGAAGGSAIAAGLGLVGFNIDPTLVTQAVNEVLQGISIVMALVAIYGRLRATTKLGWASA